MHRVDTLRNAHTILHLQSAQTLVENAQLSFGEYETALRMDGGHQLVLVVGRQVALAVEHGLTQVLQARLVLTLTDVDAVDGNIGSGGHALDVLFLTIHGTLDTAVFAFAQQINTVVAGTAPDGVLGLRINPHRFLREVEASLVDVAENADGGTLTAFKLGVSNLVGTVGEHHGGE